MNRQRREVLNGTGGAAVLGLAFAAGLFRSHSAWAQGAAWNKEAFSTKSSSDAVKAVGGSGAAESTDIVINSPDIAENGAVVPIEVTSRIPGTTSIAVLVEKNPYPLVAKFDFTADALPFVRVNTKMGETSNVRVVASAGGKHYTAAKEIKVTIGGCGG